MDSRAKRIAQRGAPSTNLPHRGRCREESRCAAAATAVVGSPLDRVTLAGGSKKTIAACYWESVARGVVGEEHGMPPPPPTPLPGRWLRSGSLVVVEGLVGCWGVAG